jgi:hypothetical protein
LVSVRLEECHFGQSIAYRLSSYQIYIQGVTHAYSKCKADCLVHAAPAHLAIPKQQFAPRHAALRPQRPTKDDFSVRSSGYAVSAKLAAFAAGRNSILALGYRPSALVNGPISSSGTFAAHMKVLATKTDVFRYYKAPNGSLASPRLIKGLGPEHQLLQRRYQPRPVRGVQLSKPVGDEGDRFLDQTFKMRPPSP